MRKSTWRGPMAATVLVLLGGVTSPAQADLLVAATISAGPGSDSTLGSLDLTTGRFTAIAAQSVNVISLTAGAGGALFAGGGDGYLYALAVDGASAQFGSAWDAYRISGLAYAGPSGFVALQSDVDPFGADSLTITPDGNALSSPMFLGEKFLGFGASGGALAYGPDGALYFDALPLAGALPGPARLFRLDPTAGVATAIGAGLGVGYDPLAMVMAGGTLYGIDSVATSGVDPIRIYSIDTRTGLATATGVVVTGLPDGYTLDAAAAVPSAVPEPPSLALALGGGCLALAHRARRGRRRAA